MSTYKVVLRNSAGEVVVTNVDSIDTSDEDWFFLTSGDDEMVLFCTHRDDVMYVVVLSDIPDATAWPSPPKL